MNEADYKPNSHKYKEENKNASVDKKRVSKVVKGNVRTKKKSEIRKFTDVFVAEDIGSVKSYLVDEVVVPGAKRLFVDAVKYGIDMLIFGDRGRARGNSSGAPHVSYRNYWEDRRDDDRRYSNNNSKSRSWYDYDDFIFESRGEADYVLSQMEDLLDRYKMVTVLDLYDLVGKSCDHTANKYGWLSLRSAKVTRVRDGYVIDLPKAAPID